MRSVRCRRGITAVELVVVLFILALLAATAPLAMPRPLPEAVATARLARYQRAAARQQTWLRVPAESVGTACAAQWVVFAPDGVGSSC